MCDEKQSRVQTTNTRRKRNEQNVTYFEGWVRNLLRMLFNSLDKFTRLAWCRTHTADFYTTLMIICLASHPMARPIPIVLRFSILAQIQTSSHKFPSPLSIIGFLVPKKTLTHRLTQLTYLVISLPVLDRGCVVLLSLLFHLQDPNISVSLVSLSR